MKKNVKGFIGLFAAIGAIVLALAALFFPTAHITGSSLSLPGSMNVTMALIAAGLGVLAIIFGILAVREPDKQGPRKAGIIIGVFAILIGLGAAAFCGIFGMVADYANNVPGNTISQSLDESQKKEFDKLVEQIRTQFPENK